MITKSKSEDVIVKIKREIKFINKKKKLKEREISLVFLVFSIVVVERRNS